MQSHLRHPRARAAAGCLGALLLAGCSLTSGGEPPATTSRHLTPPLPGGARPLIRDGAPALQRGPDGPPAVAPRAETELFPDAREDVADDMAIAPDPDDPAGGLVIAADKSDRGGLAVYDLSGHLVRYRRVGQLGNIDLRTGVEVGGKRVTLVAVNDRSDDTLRLWSLDVPGRELGPLGPGSIPTLPGNYGSCLGRSRDGRHTYAFVSQIDTGVTQQFELVPAGDTVEAREVRILEVGSQAEGCAVDDTTGALYMAEEDRGLWRYDLDPASGSRRTAVDVVGEGRLVADVEGVALARGPEGEGVVVVSSQGDSTFAVYDLDGDNAYRGSFQIRREGPVDAVSKTDGLALAAGDFGPDFPNGLLVVHDQENNDADGRRERASDLKLVRFDQVTALTPTS